MIQDTEHCFQSQAIGYAAYESDWFDAPTSMKQMLNLVMARARRPCKITAGKFMDLNPETYFLVCMDQILTMYLQFFSAVSGEINT
jgi:hypothetical protein